MPERIVELLRSDVECESLLDCLYGLTDLDQDCFRTLARSDEPMTVDELADSVDRERSTAYRSVQRLLQAGVVRQEQVTYDRGSYCHVYYPTDAEEFAGEMRRLVTDWHVEMERLIREFEDEYGEKRESVRPAES